MTKSIFLPLHIIAVYTVLLCLALPCLSSADQVETIPESSQQSSSAGGGASTDPLTSVFQKIRGLMGLDDEKPVVAVEQNPVEAAPEITSAEKPVISAPEEKSAVAETSTNAAEKERIESEKAALEKLTAEKAELARLATEKAEQNRRASEKVAADLIALERAELNRKAEEMSEQKRNAEEHANREKIAAEQAEQKRVAAAQTAAEQAKRESSVAAKEIEPKKTEPVQALTTAVPAAAAQQTPQTTTAPRQSPSSWQSVLSLVGLHDDRHSIPPMELKNSPLLLGQDYIIGPGDVIGISVWRDESLTRSAVVLPDGKIQFPLIGEIVAGGKTVLQLKQEFVEKLSKYVVDADISVDVKQSNSLVIYIIGKVNNPGRQILVSNTTVLQALSMAGGLNLFADKDDIKIFRQDNDRTVVYSFRYSKVVSGTYLDDNIMLKRGDVIVVP
jgi:polysaccharide export outer membrane protein